MTYLSMQICATALYHKGGTIGQGRKFMPTLPLQGISCASNLTQQPVEEEGEEGFLDFDNLLGS